jgi:hypothetical protein
MFIVEDVCDHLYYCIERSGIFLPTFGGKASVTSWKVNKLK